MPSAEKKTQFAPRPIFAFAGAGLIAATLSAPAAPDFSTQIAPILEQHCIECHGPDKQRGGIRYDNRSAALAEADSGEYSIVPGDTEKSGLLHRIITTVKDERMPPKGPRLAAEEVALLRDWITAGADWPDEGGPASEPKPGFDHWSFQPILNPPPPEVKDAAWAGHPVDRFLQAKRESMGMAPAPPADPAALLRRVTYDLTGLPPTPDEVKSFLEASATPEGFANAYDETVERQLASKSYGERWGRHWLDWARYADTAGDNSDFPIPQAYLYRNYVIGALNADLPYDRFLTEQLAGDLLPASNQDEKNRQTIATGYLAMARRFGSLVEGYPHHLTIEDTIDNLGRTVLGLTISCARCHDHKFDPISTRDYYGLYGFFASTRYPFPGIELFQTQRDLVPLVPAGEVAEKLAPHQKETDRRSAELEKLLAECDVRALENAAKESSASIDEQRKMAGELERMMKRARSAGEALAKHLKTLPEIPSAYAVSEGTPVEARVQVRGEPYRPGAEVPRRFPEVLGGQDLPESARAGSGRLELAGWITGRENPLTARIIVNRVWQKHFGRGIIPGSGEVGLRDEPPLHPELLDWLASDLMENGWSLKHLHRRILSSRTYRLSSADLPENLAIDPTNTALWRFERQRLDAESLRDTLLFLSGTLDPSPQSDPYKIPSSKDWKYTQHHPFNGDYPSNKRSVYQITKRLTAQTYTQTFDGPDPNVCTPSRDSSVTPLQALFFVNDTFVHQQAETFAKKLTAAEKDDTARLDAAFVAALGRSPDGEETSILLDHLQTVRGEAKDDAAAWSSLTRTILRLNEFLYLD